MAVLYKSHEEVSVDGVVRDTIVSESGIYPLDQEAGQLTTGLKPALSEAETQALE